MSSRRGVRGMTPRPGACVLALAALWSSLAVLPPAAGAQGVAELSNGYWRVRATGHVLELALDPSGTGDHRTSVFRQVSLGGALGDPTARWDHEGGVLTIDASGPAVDRTFTTAPPGTNAGVFAATSELVTGARPLGQTVTVEADVVRAVAVPLYVLDRPWGEVGYVSVRRDGPGGPEVARLGRSRFVSGGELVVGLPDVDPGTLYIEVGDPDGQVVWPRVTPSYAQGSAYTGGVAEPAFDRYVEVRQFDAGAPARSVISLEGPSLTVSSPTHPETGVALVSDWDINGYGTRAEDGVAIDGFTSDAGHHLGIAQFKRDHDHALEDFYAMRGREWVLVSGTEEADVRLARKKINVRWSLTDRTVTTTARGVGPLTLEVQPRAEQLPDPFPRFTGADQRLARTATSLFAERGLSFTGATFTEYRDWMGNLRNWTALDIKQHEREQLLDDRVDPSGYVWAWPTQGGWPWYPTPAGLLGDSYPQGVPDISGYDTRHFTTNTNFLLGNERWLAWSCDDEFLQLQLPRIRAALDYLLRPAPTGLGGQDGLLVTDEAHDAIRNHEGLPGPGSAGSNWWDGLPYGNLDAFANLYFFRALEASARIEAAAGDHDRAAELRALQALARQRYHETFWDERAGRFIQTVAVDGTRYDFGATYLNLAAVAAGLADRDQAERIWQWLGEPTSSGERDAFSRWGFAPRAHTVRNETWWAWVMVAFFGPGQNFDAQLEDGGTVMHIAYDEVMARAASTGTTDAFARFAQVIDRYAKADRLAGGTPLLYGEVQQHLHPGQVGTDTPFPESGLAAMPYLRAFLGVDARPGALTIDPNLPQTAVQVSDLSYPDRMDGRADDDARTYGPLPWAGVENLSYCGALLDIHQRYEEGVVDTVDIRAREGAEEVPWPLTVEVGGLPADAIVTGAESSWDAQRGRHVLTVERPTAIKVRRPEH